MSRKTTTTTKAEKVTTSRTRAKTKASARKRDSRASTATKKTAGGETARQWLRENGYDEIADMIDSVMAEWSRSGKATRRNWWQILAGDKTGKSRIAGGKTFPVLAAAQERCGMPVTPNAVRRKSEREAAPELRPQVRWTERT